MHHSLMGKWSCPLYSSLL